MLKTQKIAETAIILTEFYYGNICQEKSYDPADEDVITTANTIDYLCDCGFSFGEIIDELHRHKQAKVCYKDLSTLLWKDSLIKRNAFYLHKTLRLVSPAPIYNFLKDEEIEFPFYCEMKIRFTEKDVLDYFKKQLSPLGKALQEDKIDLQVIRSLMKKYASIDYVEPLDLLLCFIDEHLKQFPDCYRLSDISRFKEEQLKKILQTMQELDSVDMRKQVARRKCLI